MYLIYLIIAAAIVVGDRLSKLWILSNVTVNSTFAHLPLFDFTYVQNKGAAFSMLSGKHGLLSVISVVFCIGVIAYVIVKKPKNKLLCTALALLFGGALGNAWDRIFYGYVVDFIQTTFVNFAIFNIADIAVTVGAALLVLYAAFFEEKEKRQTERKS